MHRNKHPPLSMPPPLPSSIAPVVPSPFPSSRPTTTTSEDLGAMPFAQLMRLETVGKDVYRSIELPFAPGVGSMAFGGHVYAQAVWAAAQTIPGAMTVHVCRSTLCTQAHSSLADDMLERNRPLPPPRPPNPPFYIHHLAHSHRRVVRGTLRICSTRS
jgi:hypothetical protein